MWLLIRRDFRASLPTSCLRDLVPGIEGQADDRWGPWLPAVLLGHMLLVTPTGLMEELCSFIS